MKRYFNSPKFLYPLSLALFFICPQTIALSLRQAEKAAIQNAFDVKMQKMAERAREWEKKNKIAGYLPSVHYNGSYMRMDKRTVNRANAVFDLFSELPPTFTSGDASDLNPNPIFKNNFSHEIAVTQPIANGGAELIAINIAKHTQQAVEFQLQAAVQEAIYAIRKAYFDALKAVEAIEIAEKTHDLARKNLTTSQIRYKSGAIRNSEVLRWEAELIQSENQLAETRAAKSIAMLGLYQSMGTEMEDAKIQIPLDDVAVYERWYKKGLIKTSGSIQDNLQLKSIKSYTKAAKGYKKLAKSRYYPSLNAFFTYSWPAWDKVKPWSDRRGWTAGAAFNVPLFTGFRNTTNYKASVYEYQKVLIEERKAENQFRINLERIRLFYKTAHTSVARAKKQRELMEQQLEATQQLYNGGLANQTQLLEVALGVNQARLGYLDKLFGCLLLEAEYLKSVGRLAVAP